MAKFNSSKIHKDIHSMKMGGKKSEYLPKNNLSYVSFAPLLKCFS
jgi:hypothetical protein